MKRHVVLCVDGHSLFRSLPVGWTSVKRPSFSKKTPSPSGGDNSLPTKFVIKHRSDFLLLRLKMPIQLWHSEDRTSWYILIIKPPRSTISQIYFWNSILQVSESICVHHEESRTVHTATGMGHRGYADCLHKFEKLVLLFGFIKRILASTTLLFCHSSESRWDSRVHRGLQS